MPEAGGPTTQTGIFFQNSIAALHLARMLSLDDGTPRDTIVSVRVESTGFVDDLVTVFADGRTEFRQVKLSLTEPSKAWEKVWVAFASQRRTGSFSDTDRLVLTLGEPSQLSRDLGECFTRARNSPESGEFLARLTKSQKRLFDGLLTIPDLPIPDSAVLHELLTKVEVEVIPTHTFDAELARRGVPESTVSRPSLFGILRDLSASGGRYRELFRPASLRRTLREGHSIEVCEPAVWKTDHYRAAIRASASIEIPGTSWRREIGENFVWPRCRVRSQQAHEDPYDDGFTRSTIGVAAGEVDLTGALEAPGSRVVLVAGPGMGKTTVLKAFAAQFVGAGLLPAIVSVPELLNTDLSIPKFLQGEVNGSMGVAIDWLKASDHGLVFVLLDGLDEVEPEGRVRVQRLMDSFFGAYREVGWCASIRDALTYNPPPGTRVLELLPLDDGTVDELIAYYRPGEPELTDEIWNLRRARQELDQLLRIPLFLALYLTTREKEASLPTSRTEILEDYIFLLLNPREHKVVRPDNASAGTLRRVLENLAFQAVQAELMHFGDVEVQRAVAASSSDGTTAEFARDALVRCGALGRVRFGRYGFPFPIVREYLAAKHFSECRPAEILQAVRSAATKPWLQTILFVLEMETDASPVFRQLLAEPDDAFHSFSRLMGRALANGSSVDSQVRSSLEQRLLLLWQRSDWFRGQQIANWMMKSFCSPPSAELIEFVGHPQNLLNGGAEIIRHLADSKLALRALAGLLADDTQPTLHPGALLELLQTVPDEAMELVLAVARDCERPMPFRIAMESLICHLLPAGPTQELVARAARDRDLPVEIRLVLASSSSDLSLRQQAASDAQGLLRQTGYHSRAAVAWHVSKLPNPSEWLANFFTDEETPIAEREGLLNYLVETLPESSRGEALLKLASLDRVPESLSRLLFVYGARWGSHEAVDRLLNHEGELDIKIVGNLLSLVGHHRSAAVVDSLVGRLAGRSELLSERVTLSHHALLGMTSIFHMDHLGSGALYPARPHPGLPQLLRFLEGLRESPFESMRNQAEFETVLLRLGSTESASILLKLFRSGVHSELQESEARNSLWLREAIESLAEHGHLLDRTVLRSVLQGDDANAAAAAARELTRTGGEGELSEMLEDHARLGDQFVADQLLEAIAGMSERLGLVVRRDKESHLVLATSEGA